MARADQPLQISVGGMDRHAAHRDVVALMAPALGERDAERRGGNLGIGEEHLVEIAHAVEQQIARMRRLDLEILLHHRRRALHRPPVPPRRCARISFIGVSLAESTARRRHSAPSTGLSTTGPLSNLSSGGPSGRFDEWDCDEYRQTAAKRPTFTEQEALQFHQRGKPGKLEINPTKPMATQRDLSLAYSPGVAVPVRKIAEDPDTAYDYTAKGNLVAVISNGTAILGLGDLGALASKPVMEGKAVLFKRFADVDSIDLEVDTQRRR